VGSKLASVSSLTEMRSHTVAVTATQLQLPIDPQNRETVPQWEKWLLMTRVLNIGNATVIYACSLVLLTIKYNTKFLSHVFIRLVFYD